LSRGYETAFIILEKPVQFLNKDFEKQISNELVSLHPLLTLEFNRLTRSIDELEFWKESEYCTFLVHYTVPNSVKMPDKVFTL